MLDNPPFFDLQVNGFAGVDFNGDSVVPDQFLHACQELKREGVGGILATVITDNLSVMQQKTRQIVEARRTHAEVRAMIFGIHLEGPFLNPAPGYIGMHPPSATCAGSIPCAEALLAAGEGLVKLWTLAPEQDPQGHTIQWLVDQGVVVSAGHCNPTIDQLRMAIDHGLTMFTHLGNGCPREVPRHDNIIQRVLSLSGQLWVCFIADGVHIPSFALKNYIETVGLERAIVVSDAISAAGLGPGEYSLAGQRVIVDVNLATWSADRSHLMGAAATISWAHKNLQCHLGFSEDQALRLTAMNPRTAIGI
jgi:N-acetylglucosamine-6-phosphate deacetylase